MLTEVKAYSEWRSAPTLLLDENGRPETDLIHLRRIDGLDPVKASVNTSPYGSVDGASYSGSSVETRNIVLTLRPNPDWNNWTYESLRRLIYSYFMPKKATRLVFQSDDIVPVEIFGIVESVEVDLFSKDPEIAVSIICPDPYFTAVDPTVVTGKTVPSGGAVTVVDNKGSIEIGMYLQVTKSADAAPTIIGVQNGSPRVTYFAVTATVSAAMYFELSSVPMNKYVQNITIGTGLITNLLSKIFVREGSYWPTLQPGENELSIITDIGLHDWRLVYFERYGGL